MRRRALALAAGLWLVAGWPGVAAGPLQVELRKTTSASRKGQRDCPRVVDGEVRAGESFRQAIGQGLAMLLESTPSGWVLRVVPATGPRPEVDFAELATPPFRAVNPLLLTTDFGFRAQDVVGWNPRRFQFLTSRRESQAAERARAAVLEGGTPTPAEEMAVAKIAGAAAEGRLEIRDARLVPGTADQGRSAALVATHFLTTAHTIAPAGRGDGGALGQLEWLRFRATFWTGATERSRFCRDPTGAGDYRP